MGYGHDMNGWDWVWGMGMMVFSLVVLGVLVWLAASYIRRDQSGGVVRSTPRDELDRRLARGEIDVEEYTRRRDAMGPIASQS